MLQLRVNKEFLYNVPLVVGMFIDGHHELKNLNHAYQHTRHTIDMSHVSYIIIIRGTNEQKRGDNSKEKFLLKALVSLAVLNMIL